MYIPIYIYIYRERERDHISYMYHKVCFRTEPNRTNEFSNKNSGTETNRTELVPSWDASQWQTRRVRIPRAKARAGWATRHLWAWECEKWGVGTKKLILTPDFGISQGGRKHRKHTGEPRSAWQQELGGGDKYLAAGRNVRSEGGVSQGRLGAVMSTGIRDTRITTLWRRACLNENSIAICLTWLWLFGLYH